MKKQLSAALTSVAILSFIALAIEASDNHTVNHGANQTITAHSVCQRVTNNSTTNLSVYVPTQTSAEWQSFRDNPPSGVNMSSCVSGWKTDTGEEDWLITGSYTHDSSGWTTAAGTIPQAVRQAQTAVIGDYVYLFGGNIGSSIVSGIYRAPLSNPTSWSNTGASLPGPLAHYQLAVIGDYVYLFGGYSTVGVNYRNVIYRAPLSNPTSWSNTGAVLPVTLGQSHLAVVGNYVYLFGGWTGSGGSTNAIYRAPISNPTTWSSTGKTLPSAVNGGQLAVIGSYIYLFGGFNGATYLNTIYRASTADPTTWTNTGATIPAGRNATSLAVIGDKVYLFGGNDGSYRRTIYSAPTSNPTSWSNTGSLLPVNNGSAAATIIGNYVYIFGGYNGSSVVNTIYRAVITPI